MVRTLGAIAAFGRGAGFAVGVVAGAGLATVVLAVTDDGMGADLAGAARAGTSLVGHGVTPLWWSSTTRMLPRL
ncbi:hypothetical protein EMIT048CA2_80049 [Pseudomonas chlororaphis]